MRLFIIPFAVLFGVFTRTELLLADTYPVAITDDRQQLVTLTHRPESVAAISVFAADVMQALGSQASGLSTLNHQRTRFLGDTVAHVTDLGEVHETNMEVLTQLKPDLIVGIRTYTEPHAAKFEQIAPFLAYDLIDYADSDRAILGMTTALGKAEEGAQLNRDFAARMAELGNKAPGGLRSVLLWYWDDVPFAFYDHHLAVHIMRELQVNNAFGASELAPSLKNPFAAPISMEKLLQLDPDVILAFKGDSGPFAQHPVWQRLTAVKQQRVYRVSDHYVMPHGPIARDMVLRELAHLFYPATFAAPSDIPVAARARPAAFSSD